MQHGLPTKTRLREPTPQVCQGNLTAAIAMASSPWKNYLGHDPERNYLVMLSYLPLKHHWRIPQIFRHTLRIRKQLDTTPGVIGYSLGVEIFRKRFWTLSVWEDERALYKFVKTKPHAETMAKIHPHMRSSKFITWMSKGSALPPAWEDAKRRFAEENQTKKTQE